MQLCEKQFQIQYTLISFEKKIKVYNKRRLTVKDVMVFGIDRCCTSPSHTERKSPAVSSRSGDLTVVSLLAL